MSSGPSTTDWISAASSVVQTVGALLAILVTAMIARRSERDAARRERESVAREELARSAADARAEEAIARAAAAEQERSSTARKRVAHLGVEAIDSAIASFEQQIDAISRLPRNDSFMDPTRASLSWTAADAAIITFDALAQRTDDPVLATLLEQGKVTLEKPMGLSNWSPDGACQELESRNAELRHLRRGLKAASA